MEWFPFTFLPVNMSHNRLLAVFVHPLFRSYYLSQRGGKRPSPYMKRRGKTGFAAYKRNPDLKIFGKFVPELDPSVSTYFKCTCMPSIYR